MGSMLYSDALKNPMVPFDTLIEHYNKPDVVYKYQNFYDEAGNLNKYWKTNITGKTFRLNVASSFEDQNDCKPYFDKEKVVFFLENFYQKMAPYKVEDLKSAIKEELTQEHFNKIVSNYQNNIYIGCFTATSTNDCMWEKYSNNHTGFCIEYKVSNSELLSHNMLPVIYETRGFDSSYTYFLNFILEAYRQGKGMSFEENIEEYEEYYNKLGKLAYIPTFIKEKKWCFEEEYRLFLLPHFRKNGSIVEADKEMDDNKCINLEESVAAIHLGKNFDNNKNSGQLLDEIRNTIAGRGILLFQKKTDGTEVQLK